MTASVSTPAPFDDPLAGLPALVTAAAIAQITGRSTKTIRLWAENGTLPRPVRSAGGFRYFRLADLRACPLFTSEPTR